jgi:hypothetical protein
MQQAYPKIPCDTFCGLQDRSLVDADPVVWYSYGITHNPRVEDFPIMPVEVRVHRMFCVLGIKIVCWVSRLCAGYQD